MTKKFITTLCLAVLFLAQPVLALDRQEGAAQEISGFLGVAGAKSGLGARDIRYSVALAIGYSLSLLGVIFLVLILYAGFLWMTAGGEEENITKAQTLIRNAIIGLLIILSAFAINIFVFRALVRSTTGDPLYEPLGYQCAVVTGGGSSSACQ